MKIQNKKALMFGDCDGEAVGRYGYAGKAPPAVQIGHAHGYACGQCRAMFWSTEPKQMTKCPFCLFGDAHRKDLKEIRPVENPNL